MKETKHVFNGIFLGTAILAAFLVFGPDLRFGPDFRLSSKVINPDKEGFDPSNFRFYDYNYAGDIFYTLKSMFPIGTARSYVEGILSKQRNVIDYKEIEVKKTDNLELLYIHRFKKFHILRNTTSFCKGKPRDYFEFVATYDNTDKLINFRLTGFCDPMLSYGKFKENNIHKDN